MKINRESLLKAVSYAARLTAKKSSLPVLSHVLLDGEKQELQATDLEIGMSYPLFIEDYAHVVAAEKFPDECRIENGLADLSGPQLKNLAEDYGIKVAAKAKAEKLRETILQACREAETKLSVEAILGLKPETTWNEKFCLPCAGLKRILESLEEETVEITTAGDGNTLFKAAPHVRIGENFHDLYTCDVEEFPVIADEVAGYEFPVQAHVFRGNLDNVAVACTREEQGFNLSGIDFDLSDAGNPCIVATDGHRLHWATLNDVSLTEDLPEGFGFVMPAEAIKMIRAAFGKDEAVPIEYNREHKLIRVRFGKGGRFYIRPLEVRFPDWKAVIPKHEDQKTVTLEKSALEKPLNQALAIADGRYAGMKVRFNGGVDLEFSNPDKGSYQKISIPIKSKNYSDEEVTLSLNMKYIVEAMRPVTTDDLEIRFQDAGKALCMAHENFNAIVMPMRV